ncbi:hypothetical protein ACTU3I_07825 [Microbacterium sp. RD1]|uniref:hypothetical protein n=1 Tax=Microbacterium sp. RD1 TaxID=3457313 RepID=UPI003FA53CC8
MSDTAPLSDSEDVTGETGQPNQDREDLADLAPVQADDDAIAEHAASGVDDETEHDDPTAAQ